MKVFKIIEKIFVWIATFLAILSIALSKFVDETAGYSGIFTAYQSFFLLGSGVGIMLLLVGVLLRDLKNEVASKVGQGLTVTTFACLLGGALSVMNQGSLSAMLALAAGILFFATYLLYGIIACVYFKKYKSSGSDDPDNDRDIQNILKWKKLVAEGIISEEEFEEKRRAILKIKEQTENKNPKK
ncbi:MAG: SHOCT domain-containing protein [Bacilli bacterium]